MSAFRVGDECITRCVTALLGTDHPSAFPAAQQLGTDLRAMNVAALRDRYGQRLGLDDVDPAYTFTGFSKAHHVEIWKALHCLAYQCAEGDIPETNPLHERLEVVAEALRVKHGLTTRMGAYERAAWGD